MAQARDCFECCVLLATSFAPLPTTPTGAFYATSSKLSHPRDRGRGPVRTSLPDVRSILRLLGLRLEVRSKQRALLAQIYRFHLDFPARPTPYRGSHRLKLPLLDPSYNGLLADTEAAGRLLDSNPALRRL